MIEVTTALQPPPGDYSDQPVSGYITIGAS